MLFKIVHITGLNGEPRVDGKYPARVGREGHIIRPLKTGYPLVFAYSEPDDSTLITSCVKKVRMTVLGMLVTTARSVYHLQFAEMPEEERTMPAIDWED